MSQVGIDLVNSLQIISDKLAKHRLQIEVGEYEALPLQSGTPSLSSSKSVGNY